MFRTGLNIINLQKPLRLVTLGGACFSMFLLAACENQSFSIPGFPTFEKRESVPMKPAPSLKNPTSHMNPKNMFGENLATDTQRINRLERAMQDMRNDFETVKPSIKRLMDIEGDLQNLLGELRRLSNNTAPAPAPAMAQNNAPTNITPPAAAAPTPMASSRSKPTTYVKKSAPPVTDGTATVFDVRVGTHPDKTRIVLDVNAKTPFNVDIDNGEKIMLVDLPGAKWSAANSKSFNKKAIARSYTVETTDDGVLLAFQLKRAANVAYQKDIPAVSGSARRIVIDLK